MTVINFLILLMNSNKFHLKETFFMLLAHYLLTNTIYSVLVLLNVHVGLFPSLHIYKKRDLLRAQAGCNH